MQKDIDELEEDGFVELNSLSGLTIERIDLVGPLVGGGPSIGKKLFLWKGEGAENMSEVNKIQDEQKELKLQLRKYAAGLGSQIPALLGYALNDAVGFDYSPLAKAEGHYGTVSATPWKTAKLIIEDMLSLAHRLKENDAPKNWMVNRLQALLTQGEKAWIPDKSEPGMPNFSKANNTKDSTFADVGKSTISGSNEPLTAVQKCEFLAKQLVKKHSANGEGQNITIEVARGQIWGQHPSLLRKALLEHHEELASSQEVAKKSNGTGVTALAKCDTLAREMTLHDSNLSIEAARGRVWTLYPNLLTEYQSDFEANLPRNVGN